MALSPGQEVLAILSGRNPSPTRAELRARRLLAVDPGKATGAAVYVDRLRVETAVLDEMMFERFLGKPSPSAPDIGPEYPRALPVSPPARREMEALRVYDLDEVDWDVATMLDAHRNHCTALDEQRTVSVGGKAPAAPLFRASALEMKWDPRFEVGPLEREYLRTANRNG